jgi:hypothetical protein
VRPRLLTACTLAACVAALSSPASASASSPSPARAAPRALPPGPEAWADLGLGGIRGVTIGPIESLRHPNKGYGTEACGRALDEARAMGATWVSLTPFGRVWDLHGTGVDLSFEAPFEQNRAAVLAAIRQAHARGLKILLVPHLWVETGGWRALIDPGSDDAWSAWASSYRRFLLAWAEVAREGSVELLSVGVELRSWVTTARASLFSPIVREVRDRYPGLLTYSANWDDVGDTRIWDDLDLVGVNAFYPLADHENASRDELIAGGTRVARDLEALARSWDRPVVLTEIGYTTRRDPALKPWEWPDGMKDVVVDEAAQADAYAGIMAPFLDARFSAGFFVWRTYADPDDVSQEAEWGFSPRGKLAELVLRDAFTAHWAADGSASPGGVVGRQRARRPGLLGFDLSPSPADVWPLFRFAER